MLVLAIAGCGGSSNSSENAVKLMALAAPAAPTPTPTATPTATASKNAGAYDYYAIAPVASTVNDSFVQTPSVLSLDTATYGNRTYQGVATIARVGTRLWAAWMADYKTPGWENVGNYIVMVYSDNGGKNWSREFYMVPANPTTDRNFDPVFWAAPDGKLWLIYGQGGNSVISDGQYGAWAGIISNPLDAVPSFEPGFWMADGTPENPFQANGQWYFPSDYDYTAPRFPSRAGKIIYSFDWANHTVAQAGYVPRSQNADYNESVYVALNDGSVLAQSRSYSGILQSQSAPGTLTFPAPTVWPFYPAAPSRHVLKRSPSGRLVMVWNKNATTRTDMTIALSNDEGKSWTNVYTFDTRANVAYPSVDFDPVTGDILIVYDRSRSGDREIVFTRINESKLALDRATAKIATLNMPPAVKAGPGKPKPAAPAAPAPTGPGPGGPKPKP